jgi:nucleotide-binding universal stress UspA family protein
MKNILIPIDFTENSKILLDKASEIAKKFDSKVWIIHIAAPEPDFVGYGVGPEYIRNDRAEELKEEHRIVQKMANELKNQNINAEALLIQGPTVDSILEESQQLNIDLIVMGVNEHGFLHQLWFGDTAAGILKNTKIPLLVVPLK